MKSSLVLVLKQNAILPPKLAPVNQPSKIAPTTPAKYPNITPGQTTP